MKAKTNESRSDRSHKSRSSASTTSSWFVAVVLGCAAAAVAGTAHAETEQDKAQARARMAEGAKLLDRHDYAAALAQFDDAYRLVPSPKILFNIGVAKRGLGRNAEALEAFEGFLEQLPSASAASRAEAEKARDELKQKVGLLDITVDEAGAAVTVDGRAVGTSPLSKPVAADMGTHEVTAQKSGTTKRETASIPAAGQKVVVSLQLITVIQPAPPVGVPAAAAPPSVAAPSPTPMLAPTDTGDAPSGRPGWRVAAPWIAGGAAVVAAGAGVAALLARNDKARQYNQCGDAALMNMMDPAACSGLREQSLTRQRWEMVAFVAAGVFAAASVTLFVLDSRAPQQPEAGAVALRCAPLPDARGAAVTCGGTF